MPFVNAISGSPGYLHSELSETNCASCSAAGAVCLLRVKLAAVTSASAAAFARSVGVGKPYQMGGDVQEQFDHIMAYVLSEVPGVVVTLSPPDMSLQVASAWMEGHTFGTTFVVYAEGNVTTMDGSRMHYHFLNAHHGGRVAYVDFQSNRKPRTTGRGVVGLAYVGSDGPATSDFPFVAVLTQEEEGAVGRGGRAGRLHAVHQRGSFDPATVQLRIASFVQPVAGRAPRRHVRRAQIGRPTP